MKNNIMQGERVYLRPVNIKDANQNYLRWMNNPEVVKYTESRFSAYTLKDIKTYIRNEFALEDSVFLAIVFKKNNMHIGNIKIHRINKIHKHAEISLLIGEKSYWGQGIGAEAIGLAAKYAFNKLKLHKVYAGCYADNIGSVKAFKKCGFQKEGVMKEHYIFEEEYIDGIQLGLLNKKVN